MKISTKGRYALRMMIDLAEHVPEGYVALKDVAARQEISLKYLEQIVTPLSRAGLVASAKGPQGGYRLARPAASYSVHEVLQSIEGNLAPVSCLELPENDCPRRDQCKSLPFWQELWSLMVSYMDAVTLADLVSAPNAVKEKAACIQKVLDNAEKQEYHIKHI